MSCGNHSYESDIEELKRNHRLEVAELVHEVMLVRARNERLEKLVEDLKERLNSWT